MNNLILLNEAIETGIEFSRVCNKISLHGDEVIDPKTGIQYSLLLHDAILDVLAISSILTEEYNLKVSGVEEYVEGKIKDFNTIINSQSNPSSQPSED